jgi:hypothetical protein
MAYFKMITSTQSWSVPATGDYEVICVAGGKGSANVPENEAVGGDTSFGSYCTASGQWGRNCGGYTMLNYAEPNQCGVGYGAGGTHGSISGSTPYSAPCGKIAMAITSLTAGASITCTIGSGGAAYDGTGHTAGNSGVICIRQVG